MDSSKMQMNELDRTPPSRVQVSRAYRTNDPDRTMANILEVARTEFAAKGLAGARIDEIASLTHTSKRMIYYYFGSKEGLYIAVLESAYREMRETEGTLDLEELPAEAALRKLVGFTHDFQLAHPDFIRLVMTENINRGEFLRRSQVIQELNVPAIQQVREVYERGVRDGVFRPGLDPLDIHMTISALCFFNVSNKHTFALIFKCDLDAPETVAKRRENIIETVLRFVRK